MTGRLQILNKTSFYNNQFLIFRNRFKKKKKNYETKMDIFIFLYFLVIKCILKKVWTIIKINKQITIK